MYKAHIVFYPFNQLWIFLAPAYRLKRYIHHKASQTTSYKKILPSLCFFVFSDSKYAFSFLVQGAIAPFCGFLRYIQKHQSSFESTDENSYSRHQETNDNTTQTHNAGTHNASILESITTLLRDTLATAQTTPLPLDTILAKAKVMPLSSQTLQNTLNNVLLIDSIPLTNSLILTIITKEMNASMYEILDNNPLNLTLDYAITQNIQGSTQELQTLIIKALESYISKNTDLTCNRV